MAVRRATREYRSVVEFLEDHAGHLSQGAVLLPAGAVEGELAPEIKLDLVIPPLGRIGPITAQVVHRGSDGAVALRIPEWPASATERIDALLDAVDLLRDWFVARGELALPGAPAAATGGAVASAPVVGEGGEAARQGRGFPVPDLRAVPPTVQGSRDPKALREALIRLAADRVTGLMTFTTPGGPTRYGFWQGGGPVGFRTEPMDEGEVLGVLLYKAKQIDKEQLRESLELMQREGIRQGEAFIQMGLITFPQLVMVLAKQVEFLMQRVLRESGGEWTFHALDRLPERFLPSPLKVPAMLFRTLFQQAREMKSDTLYTSLTPYLDQYLYLPEKTKVLVPDLRLSALEQRFVDTLQANSWRVREIYSVSPLSRAITAAMLWSFVELDMLEFRTEQSDARAHAQLQILIDRKKSQVASASHFDVLEVHWICLRDEVEAAWKRLKDEFQPSRFHGMAPAAIADVATINRRLDEAHEALADDTRRREYRRTVIEDTKIQQSAELLGRQGDMAVMRHDRSHATTCYAKAVELVPGNPEYRSGLTRARGL